MNTLINIKKVHMHLVIKNHESFGEESLRINEYYQPPPKRTRRERQEK